MPENPRREHGKKHMFVRSIHGHSNFCGRSSRHAEQTSATRVQRCPLPEAFVSCRNRRSHHGRSVCHLAIKNDFSAILSSGPGIRLTFLRMPGVNRQGQAHIVSTATASPDPRCAPGAGVRLRTWFSIDPQPASINPTINISIVFICAFLVDCGRIICHAAIKNDVSGSAFL
jgi:hypothetical protein